MDNDLDRIRRRLRDELPLLAARYRVAALGVFGSYRRGTQRPDSDLDVLAEFAEAPSLFRLIEMENHLSDLLGLKVDLVPRSALKPHVGERVLHEVLPV